MAVTRLWLTDLDRRLIPVSISELDAQNILWPTVTGDPEYWFPISWDVFGVYPHTASGAGLIRADYLAWPRTLLDDEDESEFREADMESLVMYGVYDGLMKQWDFGRALQLWNRFIDQWQVGRARNGIRESQSRAFQRPGLPGVPFRSGVTR
jgi:hypothetical protein